MRAAAVNMVNFHFGAGGNAVCPCCGWSGRAFISTANWRAVAFNSACPQCDSRSRHRGLWRLLETLTPPPGALLLFAPERIMQERLVALLPDRTLHTTDYHNQDVDYPGEDIQGLRFPDSSYAFLMCNHVLEHVPDDRAAIAECARILKPGGVAVFTIPGDFPIERTVTFAQPDDNGHLRHYGMDVLEKFRAVFPHVEARDMSEGAPPEMHIRRHDMAFICRL